jgi:hypothetical protein
LEEPFLHHTLSPDHFPYFFPFVFAGMWLSISTLLSFLSGWYGLRRRYPDIDERGDRFGSYCAHNSWMGIGVNLRGVLTVESYEKGLRVKFSRFFGPFNKPLFIPWDQIRVERKKGFFQGGAIFTFGIGGTFSRMGLEHDLADQLWRVSGGAWPEKGLPPEFPSHARVAGTVILKYLPFILLAMAFFTFVPMFVMPNPQNRPPILVAILFPLIAMGIFAMVEWIQKIRRNKR